MSDDDTPVESPVVNAMRANRWKDQPAGTEEAYEARCAYWESLTDEDIWGPTGPPPWGPIGEPIQHPAVDR